MQSPQLVCRESGQSLVENEWKSCGLSLRTWLVSLVLCTENDREYEPRHILSRYSESVGNPGDNHQSMSQPMGIFGQRPFVVPRFDDLRGY